MPQTKATRKSEISTLFPLNSNYDHHHTLTQDDVDAVNSMVAHIESSRSKIRPKPGDRLIYTSRHGDYTARALIEKYAEESVN